MDSKDLISVMVRGRRIRSYEQGRICLNDIWASGNFLPNRKSQDWWRLEPTKRLAKVLISRLPGISRLSEDDATSMVYKAKGGTGGGTYAHPVLACAYAGYLSPELEVEVREVWLRYRTGDPTLAVSFH